MPLFYIGAKKWPGLSKLVEEAGEVVQVCGKLIATGGNPSHWDGTNLHERLEDELGDLLAAIDFVIERNSLRLSRTKIASRRSEKLKMFDHWHEETRRKEK